MSGAGPHFVTTALLHFDHPDIVLIDQLYMIRQWYTPASVTWHSMDATWLEDFNRKHELKQAAKKATEEEAAKKAAEKEAAKQEQAANDNQDDDEPIYSRYKDLTVVDPMGAPKEIRKFKMEPNVISFGSAKLDIFRSSNAANGISSAEWFPAENGWDQKTLDEWQNLLGGDRIDESAYETSQKDQFGPYAAGSYMSHYKLMKSFQTRVNQNPPDLYLVFEDDSRCFKGLLSEVENIVRRLPLDWDILYLGGRHISYFGDFFPSLIANATSASLRSDICRGAFGKAAGPLAPDGSRNISNNDPYWRAMYLIDSEAYVLNPNRLGVVLGVLEDQVDDGHEPVDQRLARYMAMGKIHAYSSAQQLCIQEHSDPDWDLETPRPWEGSFGFPTEAVNSHPGISQTHMWGKILLDKEESAHCVGAY